MTWLAHYTALTEFVKSHEHRHGHCPGLLERGAKQLADHLQIGAPQLEAAVKEKLLVLARRWLPPFSTNSRWKTISYPHLQKEIYMAVHWLCMLTGKKLGNYFWPWRNTSRQQEDWAELETVLPFE